MKKHPNIEIPETLMDRINAIADFQPPVHGGNLENIPVPVVIPKSSKAESLFDDFEMAMIDKQNSIQRQSEAMGAIYGRVCEHAHKLALIHAVPLNGVETTSVDVDSVKWAMGYVNLYTCRRKE